jgi:hypothetical protein
VNVEMLASSAIVCSPLMAANAMFALKAGVWVRRVRLLIVSPDSTGTTCPRSGRNSTYPSVQISGAGSKGHARNRHPHLVQIVTRVSRFADNACQRR